MPEVRGSTPSSAGPVKRVRKNTPHAKVKTTMTPSPSPSPYSSVIDGTGAEAESSPEQELHSRLALTMSAGSLGSPSPWALCDSPVTPLTPIDLATTTTNTSNRASASIRFSTGVRSSSRSPLTRSVVRGDTKGAKSAIDTLSSSPDSNPDTPPPPEGVAERVRFGSSRAGGTPVATGAGTGTDTGTGFDSDATPPTPAMPTPLRRSVRLSPVPMQK